MKKNIIFIPTYCDNDSKLEILNQNIDFIKSKYPNIDIGIYAHYPLSYEIQKKVNHYIFDISNPMVENKYLITWVILFNYKIMKTFMMDYGFAVFQMLKRSLGFCYNLGYDVMFWANYDADLQNSDIIELYNPVDKNVLTTYRTVQGLNHYNGYSMISGKFYVEVFDSIKNKLTLENYMSIGNQLIAEEIFMKIIKSLDNFDYELLDLRVKTKISTSGVSGKISENEKIKKFFENALYIFDTSNQKYVIILWNILIDKNLKIEFLFDEKIFLLDSSKDLCPHPKMIYYETEKYYENIIIKKINNEEVDYILFNKEKQHTDKLLLENLIK